jgi:hypothetical protein
MKFVIPGAAYLNILMESSFGANFTANEADSALITFYTYA